MTFSKSLMDQYYRQYLDKKDNIEVYLRRIGAESRPRNDLSRSSFETDFISVASDLAAEGKKFSSREVVRVMAQQEVYKYTPRQARASAKAYAEKHGTKEDPIEYDEKLIRLFMRQGSEEREEWFADISSRRKELFEQYRKEGWSEKDTRRKVRLEISQEFYGSP